MKDDVDQKLEKLLKPLRDLENLDDLEDNYPYLPSLSQTLEFTENLPLWWKGSAAELLLRLRNLPPNPTNQEVADRLREVYAGVKRGNGL